VARASVISSRFGFARTDYLGMRMPQTNTRMTPTCSTSSRRVMDGDGAMGTQLRAADLSLDDFEAGADVVETKYVRLQSG
jgi:hypothetical protein